jgi:hypothetical protein
VETDHDILISIENFVLGHGQNSFTGDSANNHVDGAAGNSDTVNLQGDFSDYSIQVVEGGYVLADNRDSSSLDYDGVDTYLSVESFAFKNGLYSAEQLLPPPLSNIPERNIDEPSLLISGLSGLSGLSGAGNLTTIEKLGLIPTTRIIGRGKHARTVTVSLPGWETMETMDSISGLTLTAGNGLNTISAAGQPSNAAKPAFNGQFIADGRLGGDIITGGSYRNWLIGGGIVARGSETGLSSLGIDTLIGTTGALDVFDLRSSDGLSDAYANHNAGRALISNFSVGEDAIILSGSQADYNVNINTVTKGRGKRVTTSTIVEIKSSMSTQVIASFSGSAFTSSTSAADLNIHYGILTDPSSTLINGQSLFF